VASEDALKQSMDMAVKRYSSLFKLPSTRKVLSLLPIFCIGGAFFSTIILFPSVEGLINGLLTGSALFFTSLFVDYIVSTFILRQDTIFNLRRALALSLFGWVLWLFFILIGVAAALMFGLKWWVRLCLLAFSAITIFRLVVFSSTASIGPRRLLVASLLQPFSCVIPFLLLWARIGYPITFYVPLFFLFSSVVCLVSAFSFLSLLNSVGEQTLGLHSLSLFRAFMVNWVLGLNAPLEELLERLGEERNVEISLLKFGSSKSKAVMVIPSIHPGPFKNIGSSLLPSLLKADIEKELDCLACVPHGLLGHEFDLASQLQNQRIITDVADSLRDLKATEAKASPFVKVSNGLATACCQIFGESAFISFTLAPRTIEDLPEELGLFVRQEADKHGLHLCTVVNAHNSIDGKSEMQESLASLKDVATKCLKEVASKKQFPFEVGVASLLPKEFSLEDGMGPGGITVLVVRTGQQKAAYVVIDGNNMVSGLRERILSMLSSMGIDEGEVYTTDTHSVSALVLTKYGYHPVGEAMDNEKLVNCVKQATDSALSSLEAVKVACRSITVPSVKVLGAKQLETLCLLIDRTLQKAKRGVVPIFATSGLLLMLFLLLV
jgi:putative membrane protein